VSFVKRSFVKQGFVRRGFVRLNFVKLSFVREALQDCVSQCCEQFETLEQAVCHVFQDVFEDFKAVKYAANRFFFESFEHF
jgi:hypothetical protein